MWITAVGVDDVDAGLAPAVRWPAGLDIRHLRAVRRPRRPHLRTSHLADQAMEPRSVRPGQEDRVVRFRLSRIVGRRIEQDPLFVVDDRIDRDWCSPWPSLLGSAGARARSGLRLGSRSMASPTACWSIPIGGRPRRSGRSGGSSSSPPLDGQRLPRIVDGNDVASTDLPQAAAIGVDDPHPVDNGLSAHTLLGVNRTCEPSGDQKTTFSRHRPRVNDESGVCRS